jgi:hypothetical protein
MLVDNQLSRDPEAADDSQAKQRRHQSKWFLKTKTAAMYAPTVLLLLAVLYVGFGPSPASLVCPTVSAESATTSEREPPCQETEREGWREEGRECERERERARDGAGC